jgi:hypothetical protein
MARVGVLLYRALTVEDDETLKSIAREVSALLDDFPAPFLAPLGPQ